MISTFPARRPWSTQSRRSYARCAPPPVPYTEGATSVGRDGASDAVSFLRAGVPAVEFGPVGGGHHGPDEWVSVASLGAYRRSIVDFVTHLAGRAR